MKTLYLSDLDGTLLGSNQRLSPYALEVLNNFDGLFSYATARSIVTASKVTAGFVPKIPAICSNGSFILELDSRKILQGKYFAQSEIDFATQVISQSGTYPFVNTYLNDAERVLFYRHENSAGFQKYLDDRQNDPRFMWIDSAEGLFEGAVFSFIYVNELSRLKPLHETFAQDNRFYSLLHKDVYSPDWFLEILPKAANKATAALELKKMLGADRLVVFGDGANDIPMFEVADESYAVANAIDELKAIATGIIGTNDNDSVVKFLQ